MLRVRLEIVPPESTGRPTREIGTLELWNVEDRSDGTARYHGKLTLDGPEAIDQPVAVYRHMRSQGAWRLVLLALQYAMER